MPDGPLQALAVGHLGGDDHHALLLGLGVTGRGAWLCSTSSPAAQV
nr:hypothetical protein [Streptomyces lavendulae]